MTVSSEHARLLRRASSFALLTAVTLALCKAIAWWLSDAVSLLAGLSDSLLDGAASLLNFFAVRYSLRPADADHNYGHGKAEALAGLGQTVFIGLSALIIGFQSVERLLHPQPLGAPLAGIMVMLFSLALTALLLSYQRQVVAQTGSLAIQADALHYHSDLLLNASILLALVLGQLGWVQADPLFGLAIAFYILWSALSIARQATAVLMDEGLPQSTQQALAECVIAVPLVQGCHALRTRVAGAQWFIQLHIDLADELPLTQVHQICENVVHAIQQQYPQAEVLVHADPLRLRAQRLAQHVE